MNYLKEDTANPLEDQSHPLWYGTIARNVTSLNERCYVLLEDTQDANTQTGPCYWQSRDNFSFPQRGDKCLMTMDSRSQPWVIAWWPAAPAVAPFAMPVATILDYGGSTAPTGWLLCDGTSYLRADYQALFDAVGTVYGSADGTHFNVPDLRDRVAVGKSGTKALGATGGAATHTLATAEIPAHAHNVVAAGTLAGDAPYKGIYTDYLGGGSGRYVIGPSPHTDVSGAPGNGYYADNTGGGGSHNNMQPYLALNKVIKT